MNRVQRLVDAAESTAITDLDTKQFSRDILNAEAFLYRRPEIDFFLIMVLVILGTLWSTVMVAFIEQVLLRTTEARWWCWFIVTVVATGAVWLLVRALKTPLFLFA